MNIVKTNQLKKFIKEGCERRDVVLNEQTANFIANAYRVSESGRTLTTCEKLRLEVEITNSKNNKNLADCYRNNAHSDNTFVVNRFFTSRFQVKTYTDGSVQVWTANDAYQFDSIEAASKVFEFNTAS